MLKRLYRKLFRNASKPVTTGWVKYRDHMVPAPIAAERDYILSLYSKVGGGEQALYVLNGYLFTDMDANEAEKEFTAIIRGLEK